MCTSCLYTDARLHQVVFAYCGRERELVTLQALGVAVHIATNYEAIEPSCQRYFHVLAMYSSVAPPPVSGHKLNRRYHPCARKYARGAELRLTNASE